MKALLVVLACLSTLALPAQAYSPRVTRADIIAGGGKCTFSGVCTINGTMWNCGGGGYCSLIRP